MSGLKINDPIELSIALTSGRIIPGDEIVLLPGEYGTGKDIFNVQLNGTQAQPITIRPHVIGSVRINGGFSIKNSSWLVIKDLEIAPTPDNRNVPRADVDWPDGIYCSSPNIKIVGNYIHDGAQGISLFGSPGSVVAENIVLNNGWTESDGGHGAGIYTHNHNGGEVVIGNNVFSSFGDHAVNMWSASINNVQDYVFENNTVLYSKLFAGVAQGLLQDVLIEANHVWKSSIRLGVVGAENNDSVSVLSNRAYHKYVTLRMYYQRNANIQNNVFANDFEVIGLYAPSNLSVSNLMDNNDYYCPSGMGFYDYTEPAGVRTFEQWQASGFDANSRFITSLPQANEVFVYPYQYSDRWAGMVVIWNWEGLDNVTVDLSSIPNLPQNVSLINAQNPAEATRLRVNRNSVSVPMTGTPAAPIGWGAPPSTFPGFGCFVVEK